MKTAKRTGRDFLLPPVTTTRRTPRIVHLAEHGIVVKALVALVRVLERRAPALVGGGVVRGRQRHRTRRTVVQHVLPREAQKRDAYIYVRVFVFASVGGVCLCLRTARRARKGGKR